ncbi:hypothetical protein HPB47_002680 [Ixodes persulcatus]|uniref:Uncharacterized protein n=1 Tax=Ixodes persulcatus TaxID=34615 RepID=A0AC60PKL2_IXOPE|nr:hypothetical protein HPB47_002680 [Ixodes persulcatus]
MVAGSSELKKHAERQGHKKAMLGLQKQHLLTGFVQKKPQIDSMDDKVKVAEIKLSAFITEHTLSFKAMDHMGELVKMVFPDSKIAEQSLATAVEQCLSHMEIPMKNIIALACDNASVMVAEHNSLMTRLRANADRSFVTIRCICHSLHIVASKAAMKLPRNLEDLLKNEVYLGESCLELLQSIEGGSSDVKHLRLRCLAFYQTAVFEVKERLPVSRPFYHEVQFIQPSTALSYEACKQLPVLPVLQRREDEEKKPPCSGQHQRSACREIWHDCKIRDMH